MPTCLLTQWRSTFHDLYLRSSPDLTGVGVYRSVDGAGTWSAINTGLPGQWVIALIIDPQTPTTVYAGTPSGVFKSTDGGGT